MNSILNPEAPEFYPHLSTFTKNGFSAVRGTVYTSNNLPNDHSYKLFKTYEEFNVMSCKLTNNILSHANNIISCEQPEKKMTINDDEYNMEKLMDVNDHWIDRLNINIEIITSPDTTSEPVGLQVSASNFKPTVTKIEMGSKTLIGAKNIPRPQLKFKDIVDNSDNLWVPKISDKPNNIKPLSLNIIYSDEGEAVGYEHPYKVELGLFVPPLNFIKPDVEPPTFPPPMEETPLVMVETMEQLDDLVAHLETVDVIAIDLEHHAYRTYQGITCLIQISTVDCDFIIDALAIREHINKLSGAFTDPRKLKIFHGADMDILWLQRDFGLYVVGMFDTHKAALALNLPVLSLKGLLMRYCAVETDKKYQLADWRIRPLPEELIHYAQMDTHFLLYIWRCMKAELLEVGEHLLVSVFDQSRHICGMTYNKQVLSPTSHLSLYMKSKKTFNSRQMTALSLLYKWRDTQAREMDESTKFLLPNHMLLALVETLPREIQGMAGCCSPMPPFVKQNLVALHQMLLSCRELPLESQLYDLQSGGAAHQPVLTYDVHDYSQFPIYVDGQLTQDTNSEAAEAGETGEAAEPGEAGEAGEVPAHQPDVRVFKTPDGTIVSGLNVDAKMFVPPYDRYRKYRGLAQVEEIKEYKEKEAKITAISKGNELIKKEVLLKLQEAKTLKEKEGDDVIKIKQKQDLKKPPKEKLPAESAEKSRSQEPQAQRKRKMPNEKKPPKTDNDTNNRNKSKNEQNDVKSYNYKNATYRKLREDSDKTHKQPKQKFKKHK